MKNQKWEGEIPPASIERNRAWIKGVTDAVKELNDENLSRCMMKAAGKKCAMQMHQIIGESTGEKPESVAEMIEAINKRRREIRKADTFWEYSGDEAGFRLNSCGCDIVQAGLAEPNPTYCLCSAGLFENLFSPFHSGNVRCEIVKAIGRGDDYCEFVVRFESGTA